MRNQTTKLRLLLPLIAAAPLALAACGSSGDAGMADGDEAGTVYESTGEAVPAEAAGRAMPNRPVGDEAQTDGYPAVGSDSVSADEIGSEDAEPGQEIKDVDRDLSNRATE